ncbi:MAG: ABC transporter substrate-binding protein [Stellaceae bacterium]
MQTYEIRKSLTNGLPVTRGRGFSRRSLLTFAGTLGVAAPFGIFGAARALTPLPYIHGEPIICRAAANGEELQGPPRQLKLAWNANAACTAAAAVAKERGIFAKHDLDVEFVNFGGSTDQLLEAIATGKADAGMGLALRWLKPLEQGFDVRVTAGVHGGCIRLLGSKAANIDSLESLRGKSIGISDQASPAKKLLLDLLCQKGHRSGSGGGVAPVPGQSACACRRQGRSAGARRDRSAPVSMAQGRQAQRDRDQFNR